MSGALWIAWTTLRRARVARMAVGIGALGPALIALVFFAVAGSGSGGVAQAKLEAFATDRTWSSFIGASAQITSVGLLLADERRVAIRSRLPQPASTRWSNGCPTWSGLSFVGRSMMARAALGKPVVRRGRKARGLAVAR
jgi:hypothetical protein